MTPAKTRKQQERERMTSKGFRRSEYWVHEKDLAKVRSYIARLIKLRLGET